MTDSSTLVRHLKRLRQRPAPHPGSCVSDDKLPAPHHGMVGVATVLHLGCRLLKSQCATALWKPAQSAFVKLSRQSSPPAPKYPDPLATPFPAPTGKLPRRKPRTSRTKAPPRVSTHDGAFFVRDGETAWHQWGRGFEAAENSPQATSSSHRQGFNGARP